MTNQLSFEKIRPIEIFDNEISFYFNKLIEFLGEIEIEKRINNIHKTFDFEKGYVYRNYYLKKIFAWWISFEKAMKINKSGSSFRGKLNSSIVEPIKTSYYLYYLYESMNDKTKTKLRSNLLHQELVEPFLYELEIATNFWQNGFNIDWFSDSTGHKVPEFIAENIKTDLKVEIECKTKGVDSGRNISRKDFYRLTDVLIDNIFKKTDFSGVIDLEIKEKLSPNLEITKEIVEIITNKCKKAKIKEMYFEKFENYKVSIIKLNSENEEVLEYLKHKPLPENSDIPHAVYFVDKDTNSNNREIFFSSTSNKKEKVVDSIIDELVEGMNQFSKKNPGILFCYLPEIFSFEGTTNNSSITYNVNRLFERKKVNFLWGIIFFGDTQFTSPDKNHIQSFNPVFSYNNPYNDLVNFEIHDLVKKFSPN
jgi:hypothetical protein